MVNPTDTSAFDIFNQILNEEQYDESIETCLISGNPLDASKTTLPCKHSFNYIPLLESILQYINTHGFDNINVKNQTSGEVLVSKYKCPYCRTQVVGTLPYRYDISNIKRKYINIPVSDCYCSHNCQYTDCTINATIPYGDSFVCHKHYNLAVKQSKTCSCTAILLSGARKGQQCGAKSNDCINKLCKRHSK